MSGFTGLNRNGESETLEMEGLESDKRTRFQVNRVRNESPDKKDSAVVDVSDDEANDEVDSNIHSFTERARLNSESDTKYGKSFR